LADLENGLFSGVNARYNSNDPTISDRFTTAIIKGGSNLWSIRGGNAQSGGLSTFYSGVRPSGYNPMHKEGAIILGIGGDNSNSAIGSFFEGVMVSGTPSDATENSVQSNITSVGYGAASPVAAGTLNPGSTISLRATTSGFTDRYIRHQNFLGVTSVISSSSSTLDKTDATFIVRRGLASGSCVSFEARGFPGFFLRHFNFALRLDPMDGTSIFRQDATFCPESGKSGTGTSFHSFNFPTRYIRHYNNTVYIASDGGSNAFDSATSWTADVSWAVSAPWVS
jgi:hypothetical protein